MADGRPSRSGSILAATLGATYGIYSGYELAENVPVKPGSEEYLDSENTDPIRDFTQPHSLAELVRQINVIRRQHPALHRDRGLRFHNTDNPHIVCYSKRTVDGSDVVLVIVNLDPHHMQHGFVQLPLTDWGLTTGSAVEVLDLLSNERYYWRASGTTCGSTPKPASPTSCRCSCPHRHRRTTGRCP